MRENMKLIYLWRKDDFQKISGKWSLRSIYWFGPIQKWLIYGDTYMHVDSQVNFIWRSLRSILYRKWGQKDRFDGYELVPEWPPPLFQSDQIESKCRHRR